MTDSLVSPQVTVFMAVYNGAAYLNESINSILGQTFKDFELLIVNDGSTDSSLKIIEQYNDPRISVISHSKNRGLFETRNTGLDNAKGEYFAVLDCDDIASLRRLEIQVKYMKENPEFAMCGGRVKYVNEQSEVIGNVNSINGNVEYLKALLLFTNIYCNSSTIYKTEIIKEYRYRPGFEPAEDFDLFERIASNYPIGFINEFLGCYRIHANNISSLKKSKRLAAEREIIKRQLQRYNISFSDADLDIHLKFTEGIFDFEKHSVEDYADWFKRLRKQNAERGIFSSRNFSQALTKQWLRLCQIRLKSSKNILPFFNGIIDYTTIHKLF